MKNIFAPVVNQMYVFDNYSLFIINSGNGIFQVDFKDYTFSENKAFFLSPGQSFQLLAGGFSMTKYDIEATELDQLRNARFLFKHIIGLGFIDLSQNQSFEQDTTSFSLNNAVDYWLDFNPFKTSMQNINLLFDLKQLIDKKYQEPIDISSLSKELNQHESYLEKLTKDKLNYTIQKLKSDKMLLEAKKKIAFTDWTTKEIAYETGFNDPAYFNRFFKKQTQQTPQEFRNQIDFQDRDTFMNDLLALINLNFKQQHSVDFYASKMSLTTKSLSQKISKKSSVSVKQLITQKIIQEAEQLIKTQMPVYAIAEELGFQEPNHFTSFFKTYTGKAPSQFQLN
jgi:AraC-like DNA-binding protein